MYFGETTQSTTSAGAYLRKYYPIVDGFFFYGRFSLDYVSGSSTSPNTFSPDFDMKEYNVSVTPGFIYFSGEKIGLILTVGNIGYSSSTKIYRDNLPQEDMEGFTFDISLSSATAGLTISF